jgi:hypothetical protein
MRLSDGFVHRVMRRAALAVGLIRGAPVGLHGVPEGETEPIDPSTHFESGDINVRAVMLAGIGTLLALWAIVVLVYPVFSYFKAGRAEISPPPIAAARHGNPMPPEPRIQANPQQDLHDFRAYEERELKTSRWIDRAHGVVSIPIANAIRIVAQRGIPPQPAPADQTYFDPRAGTRLTGFEGKVEPEPR